MYILKMLSLLGALVLFYLILYETQNHLFIYSAMQRIFECPLYAEHHDRVWQEIQKFIKCGLAYFIGAVQRQVPKE